jgi:hypothetical protein
MYSSNKIEGIHSIYSDKESCGVIYCQMLDVLLALIVVLAVCIYYLSYTAIHVPFDFY